MRMRMYNNVTYVFLCDMEKIWRGMRMRVHHEWMRARNSFSSHMLKYLKCWMLSRCIKWKYKQRIGKRGAKERKYMYIEMRKGEEKENRNFCVCSFVVCRIRLPCYLFDCPFTLFLLLLSLHMQMGIQMECCMHRQRLPQTHTIAVTITIKSEWNRGRHFFFFSLLSLWIYTIPLMNSAQPSSAETLFVETWKCVELCVWSCFKNVSKIPHAHTEIFCIFFFYMHID